MSHKTYKPVVVIVDVVIVSLASFCIYVLFDNQVCVGVPVY